MKIEINTNTITIDQNQVLKFLGYGKKEPAPIIRKKMLEEIERVPDLLEPQVFLKYVRIDNRQEGEISFANGHSIKSNYVAKSLMESDSMCVLLYTIGDKIQQKINEYSESNEMIRAMLLDKIGVVALDDINARVKNIIEKEMHPLKISAQLYPSQKDFDISNQKMLFDLFEDENKIITISKYNQFHPIKTVVCIFGLGETKDNSHMCDDCEQPCY
jgi:hypothetical protein